MISEHTGEPHPPSTVARWDGCSIPQLLCHHDLLYVASLWNSGFDRRKAITKVVPKVDPAAGGSEEVGEG